jgi:hypothetical protein
MSPNLRSGLLFAAIAATALLGAPIAGAATAPIKEIETNHVGREVNKAKVEQVKALEAKGGKATAAEVEEENICSASACQPAKSSGASRGFEFAQGIASAPDGNIYIADKGNHRVQELTAKGEFVLMFGRSVNKTKEKEAASQAQRNICTAASGDVCQAGARSEAPGAIGSPLSVVAGPEGNIYVAEFIISSNNEEQGERVQKLSATGEFLFEIGKEVNETTKKNLCSKEEKCKGPALSRTLTFTGVGEPGVFNFGTDSGNILAIGGPAGLLYVGDEHRVQEFEAIGVYKTEISLASLSNAPGSQVTGVAVDKAGDVYLIPFVNLIFEGIHEFNPAGEQVNDFLDLFLSGSLTLDPVGRLAATEFDKGEPRGTLYDVAGSELHLITTFINDRSNALAFSATNDLYAVNESEVITYTAEPVGELLATQTTCVAEAEHETDATSECDLGGKVDAWGVKGTEVWFEWGQGSLLNERTPSTPIKNIGNEGEEEPFVPVTVPVKELRPNETFRYGLTGEDVHVESPETLTSAIATFSTPLVAPKVIGEPSASFVKSASAVMFSELNPENATTEYFFEYAPETLPGQDPLSKCINVRRESCPGVAATPGGSSASYGRIGTTLEATGLQPETTYRYRLFAESQNNLGSERRQVEASKEGSFTTGPAPVPQATTGAHGAVTTTSAVISGTVDPDGQAASYSFEVGVNHGASTEYGTVFTGPAGAATTPTEETLELTGLQPGTSYSYRITIKSGYIKNEAHTIHGAAASFETAGLPVALAAPSSLEMLAVPPTPFPQESGKVPLTQKQLLATALKLCKEKRSRRARSSCERAAHNKYGNKKKKTKSK